MGFAVMNIIGYFVWTLTTILTFALWTDSLVNTSFEKSQHCVENVVTHCKTEIDSLTKKTVYISVDKEAVNEGGQIALMKEYQKITLDSISEDLDTRFAIAFIVEPNGQITGERIIKDKIGNVGQKMIKIAKSFKWIPAECDGQRVSTLVKLPLQMCLQQN